MSGWQRESEANAFLPSPRTSSPGRTSTRCTACAAWSTTTSCSSWAWRRGTTTWIWSCGSLPPTTTRSAPDLFFLQLQKGICSPHIAEFISVCVAFRSSFKPWLDVACKSTSLGSIKDGNVIFLSFVTRLLHSSAPPSWLIYALIFDASDSLCVVKPACRGLL